MLGRVTRGISRRAAAPRGAVSAALCALEHIGHWRESDNGWEVGVPLVREDADVEERTHEGHVHRSAAWTERRTDVRTGERIREQLR